jgi:hypothetical protein
MPGSGATIPPIVSSVWQWLLEKLGRDVQGSDPTDLARASFCLEAWRVRLRGWRELRRKKRSDFPLARMARLVFYGSPVHLLLVCGSFVACERNGSRERVETFLKSFLPIRPLDTSTTGQNPGQSQKQTLVTLWYELVQSDVVKLF